MKFSSIVGLVLVVLGLYFLASSRVKHVSKARHEVSSVELPSVSRNPKPVTPAVSTEDPDAGSAVVVTDALERESDPLTAINVEEVLREQERTLRDTAREHVEVDSVVTERGGASVARLSGETGQSTSQTPLEIDDESEAALQDVHAMEELEQI